MAEESGQDKTEEPTAQRLKKAREDGQIARSQELAPAAMMVIATLFFTMMGQHIFTSMSNLFKHQLQFDRRITDKAELLPAIFGSSMVDGFLIVLPLMAILYVIAILSTTLAGGFIFSPSMIMPKFSKLNPMTGLARMFGPEAFINLGKSLLKFLLVGAILLVSVMNNLEDLTHLANGFEPRRQSSWHHHCGFVFLAQPGVGFGRIGGCAFATPSAQQEAEDDQARGA